MIIKREDKQDPTFVMTPGKFFDVRVDQAHMLSALYANVDSVVRPNCVVFDIDGTIADNSHRDHLLPTPDLTGEARDAAWEEWYSRCIDDTPIPHVVHLMHMYRFANVPIVISTGRRFSVMQATIEWFDRHELYYNFLFSRKDRDRREDTEVKKEHFGIMRLGGLHPMLVYEDRTRLVEMWRSLGVPCFQVKASNF